MKKKTFTPKYNYIVTANKVICISHYAKRLVKGIAKCAPGDTFDEEKGKKLAKLRCDIKVAQMRYKNASADLFLIHRMLETITASYNDANEKFSSADKELSDLINEYDSYVESL